MANADQALLWCLYIMDKMVCGGMRKQEQGTDAVPFIGFWPPFRFPRIRCPAPEKMDLYGVHKSFGCSSKIRFTFAAASRFRQKQSEKEASQAAVALVAGLDVL